MIRHAMTIVSILAAALTAKALEAPPLVEDGDTGWTLTGGTGALDDTGETPVLRVEGDGASSNAWESAPIAFEPGGRYVLQFEARSPGAVGGTATSGPAFANRDLGGLPETWRSFTSVFQAPAGEDAVEAPLRFGQWELNGAVEFRDIALFRAAPAHHHGDGLVLGAGERIMDSAYIFEAPFYMLESNDSRPLAGHDCFFNTNRWAFSPGDYVRYEHEAGDLVQTGGQLTLSVTHYQHGEVAAEARAAGAEEWRSLGVLDGLGARTFTLPDALFPAEGVEVRLRATDDGPVVLQVSQYEYFAELEDAPDAPAVGASEYAAILNEDADVRVDLVSLGALTPGGDNTVDLAVEPTDGAAFSAAPAITIRRLGADGEQTWEGPPVEVDGPARLRVGYDVPDAGRYAMTIALGGDSVYEARVRFDTPILHATGYGEALPASTDDVGLWWCSSGWNVSAARPVPDAEGAAMRISAARNEAEAAQFVLRPAAPLEDATVAVNALSGPDGAELAADAIEALQVGYVPVTLPSDEFGSVDDWPDPLLPLDGALDLPAGANQPFWVRVTVPADQPAGLYSGSLTVSGRDYEAEVPLEVNVYDFTLPDEASLTTAFGFTANRVFEYHNVTEEAGRRAVLDGYLEAFSGHRISPYNPTPLDAFNVQWPDVDAADDPAELEAVIDWTGWDAAMERVLAEHHFNSFRIPPTGMGGGSFYTQYPAQLQGYSAETPEFQALFESYWTQVEEHLKEKGWLDKAYLYFFDEPSTDDYSFVMEEYARLEAVAPDIPWMLTEHPAPELHGGPDIWCPLASYYDREEAAARQALGEEIWWYVCTVPKAPYPGLFIDHPGTALRAWLWQTWGRNIDGILIWDTVYWTSDAAYPDPDAPQNPYEDPMAWQTYYGREPGDRFPWGNGDGRFLYPPRAAADGRPGGPVLDPPVVSIRWEMLRDGVEDYEYMVILSDLLERHGDELDEETRARFAGLLETPAAITATQTEWSRDPAPIEEHRHRVAQAIEVLSLF